MPKSNLTNVTGLWLQEAKSGNKYLSKVVAKRALQEALDECREDDINVMVFFNRDKKSDKHPDGSLCFSPWEQREKKQSSRREEDPNDSIPF